MAKYRYTVTIGKDEYGIYIAHYLKLHGCYTQEETIKNIIDAIELHIKARKEIGEEIPIKMNIDEWDHITPNKKLICG